MTKTLPVVSHKNYNLRTNEGFEIFLNSKLITCFIDDFTLKMKSRSVAYLLNGSEHIYWIFGLEGKVHSIWDLWTSGLQKCKCNDFFKVRRTSRSFRSGPKNLDFLIGGCSCPNLPPPKSS